MKTAIPLPAFLPDQTINSGVLLEAKNVYPLADGYGPVRGFQDISAALSDAFLGGASFIADDGTSYLLVGTADGLVRYTSGTWTSLITGMTVTEQWRFAQFGNFAVAVNGTDTKVVDLIAGTASTLTGAPVGRCVTVVGGYMVIGQDTSDLLSVFTSDINDHTRWVPDEGATQQPQLTGGEVMGLAGGEYGVILQRRQLTRMTVTGDVSLPFEYDVITDNIGCASRGSVTQYGRSVFFLSDQGFMALEDGQVPVPIGAEAVDRTFQALVPPEDYEKIFAAVDPKRKLIIWCVPGSPGSLWIYNYVLKRWTIAELSIGAVFSGFTSSETLEGVSVTFPDLDAMTLSLDDPRFSGGAPQFYAVQDDIVGSLSGDSLKATWQLGFTNFAGETTARIRDFRPVTNCTSGLSMEVDVRARLGDAPNVKNANELRPSGVMPVRANGRYAKIRMEIAAGSVWDYMQAVEVEFERGGER